MAIIATEGFDNYSTFTDVQSRPGNLVWVDRTIAPQCSLLSPGRSGVGQCARIPTMTFADQGLSAAFKANQATWIFGFAFRSTANPDHFIVQLTDSAVGGISGVQISLYFETGSGQVNIYRGFGTSTLLASSAPSVFAPFIWSFFEIKATINNTSGSIQVQVNGAPVVSYTGDTQVTANAAFGEILLVNQVNGVSDYMYIDDFRYNDTTTGPGIYPCNDFLGDLTIQTIYPISNFSTAWTPLSGSNWQMVSETLFDGDATYNSSSTIGAEDLFNMGAVTGTISEIVAVSVKGGFRVDAGGTHTLTQSVRASGSDHDGQVWTLGGSYQFVDDLYAVNPTTSASWTLTDVNSIQVGYKVQS